MGDQDDVDRVARDPPLEERQRLERLQEPGKRLARLGLACDGDADRFGVLDVQVAAQENCFPMVPAGVGHHRVMLSRGRWYEEG